MAGSELYEQMLIKVVIVVTIINFLAYCDAIILNSTAQARGCNIDPRIEAVLVIFFELLSAFLFGLLFRSTEKRGTLA